MNKPTKAFDAVHSPKVGEPAHTETPVAAMTVDTAIQPVTSTAQNESIKGPFTKIPATDGVHVQPVAAISGVAVQVPTKA